MTETREAFDIAKVRFDGAGLIAAVACDADTGEVLMVAWMNREALEKTLREGVVTYWSRSRGELWTKGLTSGHTQEVTEIRIDCDLDCVLLRVRQRGGACHNGFRSCFYRRIEGGSLVTDREKVFDDESVYKRP
ncbi:MAG: phosphoribosyl-AMP cyclohydrolase [Candidatus Sumerlaeia bacterium]|nr:phosphoribosyl-AMP cyclohydrolase [Candidatus Sumerlaeia bacterium]